MNWERAQAFVTKHRWPLALTGVVLVMIGSFLMGRYTGPTKTVEKTKTEYIDREVVRMETKYVEVEAKTKTVARDVRRERRVEEQPDGTKVTTVVIVDKTKVNEASTQAVTQASSAATEKTSTTTTSTEKIVESARPDWRLGLQLGAGLVLPAQPIMAAGLSLDRRIAGPFWVGIWGQMQLNILPTVTPQGFTAGIGVALEF